MGFEWSPMWIAIGLLSLIVCGIVGYLYYHRKEVQSQMDGLSYELHRLKQLPPPENSCRVPSRTSDTQKMISVIPEESEHEEAEEEQSLHDILDKIEKRLDEEDAEEEDSFGMSSIESAMSSDAEEEASVHTALSSKHSNATSQRSQHEFSSQIRKMDQLMKREFETSSAIHSEDHRRQILESLQTKKSELDALHSVSQQDANSELRRLVGSGGGDDKRTAGFKLKDLKTLCVQNGLPGNGTKQQLLERLQTKGVSLASL